MAKAQRDAAASGAASGPARLDAIDHQVLGALSVDGRLTNKALANRLGIAESTCAYRVRALRDSGVIQPSPLRLDLAALGYPLQAIIKVRLGSHDQAGVNRLHDELAATPGVLQVFHVAGNDDFHVYVAVEDAEALRDFVLRHVTSSRVVTQTETQLIFELRDGPGVLPHDPEARKAARRVTTARGARSR